MVFDGIKSGDERKDTSVINRIMGLLPWTLCPMKWDSVNYPCH